MDSSMLPPAGHVVAGGAPKYRQIVQLLRSQILSGALAPNAQLPTEDELGQAFGVSRGTVRKAIEQLEAEHLIRTEHGIGSFVVAAHPRAVPFHFVTGLANGFDPQPQTYRMLAQEVIAAPFEVAERLRLPPGTPVIHVERLALRGGRVIARTARYLPESLCPVLLKQDLSQVASIHELLVGFSELPLLRAEIQIEAQVLSAEEAAWLQVPAGTSALIVNRLTYTAPNRPAVWYRAVYVQEFVVSVRIGDPVMHPAQGRPDLSIDAE